MIWYSPDSNRGWNAARPRASRLFFVINYIKSRSIPTQSLAEVVVARRARHVALLPLRHLYAFLVAEHKKEVLALILFYLSGALPVLAAFKDF